MITRHGSDLSITRKAHQKAHTTTQYYYYLSHYSVKSKYEASSVLNNIMSKGWIGLKNQSTLHSNLLLTC